MYTQVQARHTHTHKETYVNFLGLVRRFFDEQSRQHEGLVASDRTVFHPFALRDPQRW
jgi:hypothetical protein